MKVPLRALHIHPVLNLWLYGISLTASRLLQLFMLFLAHAHGSRYQGAPQGPSIPTNRPSEHAFRRPAGSPTLFLDGSWWSYWPCLIPWLLLEAANTVAWLSNSTWGKGRVAASPCKCAHAVYCYGLIFCWRLLKPSCLALQQHLGQR